MYCCITCISSWLIWSPAVLQSANLLPGSLQLGWLRFAGSCMPTLTAVFFVWREAGAQGLRQLLRKGLLWKFSVGWYCYAFLLLPLTALLASLLAGFLFGDSYPAPFPARALVPIFFVILIAMGPLEEEFGWRGYALDRLLTIYSPLQAGIVVGLVWSVWHLPLFFMEGTIQSQLLTNGLLPMLLGYCVQTVLLSILLSVLYQGTGGSVLAVMLMHGVSNLTHGYIPLYSKLTGGACLLAALFTATAVVWWAAKKRTCAAQKAEVRNS